MDVSSHPDRGNPPVFLTSFVGREAESAAIVALLVRDGVRLLTLAGPGGVGKTRLALHVAGNLSDSFPDAVWFVSLAHITDPALLETSIAHALGVHDTGDVSLAHRLRAFLADRCALLVLDNFEQVVDNAAALHDLLGAAPRLRIMVTSRVRLRVSGEHVFSVPPLNQTRPGVTASFSPGAQALSQGIDETAPGVPMMYRAQTVSPGDASEAVRLFVARAAAVHSDFALTADNASIIEQICARLDGLPLAIELAAAHSAALPPVALLARLERRLPLPGLGPRDLPARQQTVQATIAWSHALLTDPEQVMFRRLGVFSGGFTLAAAEAVLADAEDIGLAPDVAIFSLLDKSLLHRVSGPLDEPRFTLLETIREFALDRLQEAGERERFQDRHAQFFLSLSEQIEDEEPNYSVAERNHMARLQADYANIRVALGWAVERGKCGEAVRFVDALRWFWRSRNLVRDGRDWTERVLAMGESLAPIDRIRLLTWNGDFFMMLGDARQARASCDRALKLAQELGDDYGRLLAHLFRGLIAVNLEEEQLAEALLSQTVAIAQTPGEAWAVATALDNLGTVARRQGKLGLAQARYEEALAISRNMTYEWNIAEHLCHLAGIAADRHEWSHALALYRDSLARVEEIGGDTRNLAGIVAGMARVIAASGHPQRAARLCGAVAALHEAAGVRPSPAGRLDLQRAENEIRPQLDEPSFQAAFLEGSKLTLAGVLADVRSDVPYSGPGMLAGSETGIIATPYEPLTPREVEVLQLLAQGLSNRDIAARLHITVPTVKRHVSTLLGKLHLSSRSAATAYAHTRGLV